MCEPDESFVLHYRTYGSDTQLTQVESCPVVVIHGILGTIERWHEFCKYYSELTGRMVGSILVLLPKFLKACGRHIYLI